MANEFDQKYWDTRWKTGQTQWDVGMATPPITNYFKNVQDPNVAILIPGCGNAYEAQYLLDKGFQNITIVEIVADKVEELKGKFARKPIKIVHADFFSLSGSFNYIIEQTFFCALDPSLRIRYAEKMHDLLAEDGKVIGVLFNKDFGKNEPPFGGTLEEYYELFGPYFSEVTLEPCKNSIAPRRGNELFIKLQK